MLAPDNFNPAPGIAEKVDTNVRRILAPNPSPMTYRGTNTYLVGSRDIAVIDPGPDDTEHLESILAALTPEQKITHIVVTHNHIDHSPLSRVLSDQTSAPIYAFGGAGSGRTPVMAALAESGLAGGGEGIDTDFKPDCLVADGEVISGSDWQLEVIHTPGHLGNHIALAMEDLCFTADHVMGWASSLVSPPDGDLTDFMASCRKLRERRWRVFHPGHGAPIEDPAGRLDWLIAHRTSREEEILASLAAGEASVSELARSIYVDTPSALLPAAERNVFAHLVDLVSRNLVSPNPALSLQARFSLCSNI